MKIGALLNDRRFRPFFWTQFLGALNDNVLKNGLVILIAFRSLTVFDIPPGQMIAFCGGVFILPFFLFSAFAGEIADRREKSGIIRLLKFIEIPLMFVAGYGFMTGRYELLVFVLFCMGVQSAFFGPIKYSIIPQLIREEELVAGTALVESGTFAAILLGTIIGGLLVSMGAFAITAGLVIFAVAGWLTSLFIQKAEPAESGSKMRLQPFSQMADCYRHIIKEKSVLVSVIAISWFWFFGAAVLSLLPAYTSLTLTGNEQLITLFLSLFTIGIGIGSILCAKLSPGKLETGIVPAGAIGMTFFSLLILFVGAPSSATQKFGIISFLGTVEGAVIFFAFLFLSVSGGLFIVPLYTLIQQRTDLSDRSRIIAGNNILNALFMVVSAGAVMACYEIGLTIPQMFGLIGLLNAVVSTAIFGALPEFPNRFLRFIRNRFQR
jgi:MFS family permease